MKSTVELANRLRAVVLNGTWIANTNYQHQLTNINWQTATHRYAGLNSVAVLVQHLHYYIAGLKRVLEGGTLDISDRYSFDFPEIASELQWQELLQRFFRDAASLALLIEQMPEQKMAEVFVDERYGTYERNLEGMIEHSYYHLGQVVLILKLLKAIPG